MNRVKLSWTKSSRVGLSRAGMHQIYCISSSSNIIYIRMKGNESGETTYR
ncbi:hypothetical protein Hanom_Chr14g01250311 [Helianthus anomalus]